MINKIKNLLRKKFIKDMMVLQVGGVLSSVIFFVGSIILARVLGVDLYGQYVLIFAFISLVNLFTNWGEQGVVLTIAPEAYAKGDLNRFKEVIQYFFFITFISTFIVNLAIIFFAPWFTDILYHNAQIGNLARVVMVMSIVQVLYSFFIVILHVIRKVKYAATLDIINKFFHVGTSVLLVVLGYGLWGIVYGKLIVAVGFFFVAIFGYHTLSKKSDLIPPLRKLIFGIKYQVIKKFFRFGVAISLDKNIGSLFGILPLLLLGFYGSLEQVTFYKVAYSYIGLPAMLIGPVAKLLSVQLPQSKAYGMNILKRDFWRSTIFSGLINFILVMIFLIPASILVKFFYGADFIGSVPAIYYLSIVFILSGFNIGAGAMIKTIRKVKYSILINLCTVTVQLVSFYVLFSHFHYTALVSVILSQIILTVFNMIIIFTLIIRHLNKNQAQSSLA